MKTRTETIKTLMQDDGNGTWYECHTMESLVESLKASIDNADEGDDNHRFFTHCLANLDQSDRTMETSEAIDWANEESEEIYKIDGEGFYMQDESGDYMIDEDLLDAFMMCKSFYRSESCGAYYTTWR